MTINVRGECQLNFTRIKVVTVKTSGEAGWFSHSVLCFHNAINSFVFWLRNIL